jgi:hypothetical protein
MAELAVTFFIHETHDPQRVAGHMAASEPSSVGRLGPELRNMWQHQSPPQLGLEQWDTWWHQSPPQLEGGV